jgi:hypothetical protein
MAITLDSTSSVAGQVSDDTTDTSGETYASDLPSWLTDDLTSLAQEGKLYGIDPHVLGALTQAEEGGQGGYVNAESYGGYFGLGDTSTYPGGSPSHTLLTTTGSPSFEEQAEIVASQIAYNEKTTSDLYAAVAKSWGGDASYLPDYGIPNTSNSGLTFPTNVGYGPTTVTGGKSSPGQPAAPAGPQSFGAASTMGKILIQLDLVLNPTHSIQSPGTLESILTLGAADVAYGVSDVAMIVATVIFRGFFVLGFLALLWTGIQDLTEKRAGRVAGIAAAPIKSTTGAITHQFGTGIQRKRESRLEGAADLAGRRLEQTGNIAQQRSKDIRTGSRATSTRQNKALQQRARAQYLKTFGEFPEDAGYKWDARSARFK